MTTTATIEKPLRLYRFAFGLSQDAADLYTLALIPARSDDEAFDKGCALMPADAPTLAQDFWTRGGGGWPSDQDPAGAFFTAQELETVDEAEGYADELPSDLDTIAVRFGVRVVRNETCAYCNGTGIGSYWLHSLEQTEDFPCHICKGEGVTDAEGAERGKQDARAS